MSRTPVVAGNWKMHKTVAETKLFVRELLQHLGDSAEIASDLELVICPPYLALEAAVGLTKGTSIQVLAQNMHEEDSGAFTGEVSPAMLKELGVHGVILGHSERREYFGETDRALQLKVPKALNEGLKPILCVGETEEERERGETERKLRHQVQEALEKVPVDRIPDAIIAYEPIWAIGTGLVATSEQAQEALAFVRALVAGFDRDAAEQVRILYGGSVKAENAEELLALPDIDGALIGGASLDAGSFAQIIQSARSLTTGSAI